MDINKIKSNLKMNNFYFSEYSFKREPVIQDGGYNIDLKKEIQHIGNHEYDVSLKTTIKKQDMELIVVANAQFIYEAEDYAREEGIINANTVAIMFPFVRSQVTLMTSQPGMTPVVLPTINTAKFK
jgi:preprotein translocase subunit SecB